MIEFKQIIGRGTRLYDGKDYFTIYDFVKAYHPFNDPEWEGEPVDPVPAKPPRKPSDDQDDSNSNESGGVREPGARWMTKIKLADGKERTIQHMMATSFWSPDGKPI